MKNATPEPERTASGGGSQERPDKEGTAGQVPPEHPRHVPSASPDDLPNGSGNDGMGSRERDSDERFDAG
ncbi:hypothetical protein NCCP1664_21490 [Zafaria cholistanensis]|uniref:Uncharacterized protein n=1 Tax=Zafaria cholistanensis TaxID=1682741 RepID=A0A5A7NRX2_9MICC|nr:hypothetical protein [Zafaria cholistanensis]GER23654.1 hypothetical protein NCCP1664_21490 [Zafaria cholistanensis]